MVEMNPELVDCPECGLPAVIWDDFTIDDDQGSPVSHRRTSCIDKHHITSILPG